MKTIEGLFVHKEKSDMDTVIKNEFSHEIYRFYHTGFVLRVKICGVENLNYQLPMSWLTMENLYKHEFGKYAITKNKILMQTYEYISDDFRLSKFTIRGYLEDDILVIKYRPSVFKPMKEVIYHKVKFKYHPI